jgi:6-pyruvoyl-tetrahydropterin synthase
MDNELVPYEEEMDMEHIPEPKEEVVRAKGGRKTTGSQSLQRLNEAVEMVLYQNLTHDQFVKEFPKRYGVSENMAKQVWVKVKAVLKERSELKQDEIIANQVGRYMDLLQRAREDGNKRVERETLWDMSRIMGLDQRKVDITSDGLPLDIKINLSNNPKDFGVGN